MPIIRGVMFDFGNVLGIFDLMRVYSFVESHRGNCFEPKELFSGSLKEAARKFDLGHYDEAKYFSIVQEAFQLKISKEDYFRMTSDVLRLDLEMLKIVNDLRQRGVTTILVTNMNTYHARYIRQHYPEVMDSFDYKMISCEEGVAKPDSEALIRPLEWAGLSAEEVIFIDDYQLNIEAACQLGVKGWYYNVTDQYFCSNGKLDEERRKFKGFLNYLDSMGLLYSKTQ